MAIRARGAWSIVVFDVKNSLTQTLTLGHNIPIMIKIVALCLLALIPASNPDSVREPKPVDVSKIYGRIQLVDSFPDYTFKVVSSFEDLRVKKVKSFPTSCGKWKIVNSFPDFKLKLVKSFPDFTVKYVTSFPGIRADDD